MNDLLKEYKLNYTLDNIPDNLDTKDVIIYDSECHACILDGVRLHAGKRFVFQHNDMQGFEKQLQSYYYEQIQQKNIFNFFYIILTYKSFFVF